MCADVVRDRVEKKFGKNIPGTETFCALTAKVLDLEPTNNTPATLFQLDEIMHYTTVEDIQAGTVVLNGEERQLEKLFNEFHNRERVRLQEPDTTLGTSIHVDKCVRCQSSNTLSMARQTRSVDEPMSIYVQCLTCGHRWRLS